jgi:molybdopterin/thiamine biosynthesis adenylyltransferase
MHEAAVELLEQKTALEGITTAVCSKWPGAKQLSGDELINRFKRHSLIAGWRLPAEIIAADRDFILALPDLFPRALPIVALAESTGPGELPHVESDGTFCLSNSLMELPVDIRHAEHVVLEASRVLSQGLTGENHDDFLTEASTYWTLGQPVSKEIWLISSPHSASYPLYVTTIKHAVVLADSTAQLESWLTNAYPGLSSQIRPSALLLKLPAPLFPHAYPKHTGELVTLAATTGEKALNLLASTLKPQSIGYIVFSFEHEKQTVLLGLRVDVGSHILMGGKTRLPLWHGHRKDHVPGNILLQRIASARFPVVRMGVTRVDSDSLLHRTVGSHAQSVSSINVAVIGCGALGGMVVQLLAQAGIRQLTLVDGDILTWQNIGRHVLTGQSVGSNKAAAMKADILARFPDYDVDAVPERWEQAWKESPDLFREHDMIIALSADWSTDSMLNTMCKQCLTMPAVLFGWVEAHALAGHAVMVLPDGGCLHCLTDKYGEFQHSVSKVPLEHGIQREASCGSIYQPFAAAAAAPTAAMIVKTALDALTGRLEHSEHRTWVGAKDQFDAVDASVTPGWFQELQINGHERVYRKPIFLQTGCPICGRMP